MASAANLEGTWKADLDRWIQLDPDMGQLGKNMLENIVGPTEVTFSAGNLAIKNFGGKGGVKEFTYSPDAAGDPVVLDVTMAGSGRKGVYEITFRDDNHIDMILTEPKRDAMALVRA